MLYIFHGELREEGGRVLPETLFVKSPLSQVLGGGVGNNVVLF